MSTGAKEPNTMSLNKRHLVGGALVIVGVLIVLGKIG
jgi:hypothetical protein